MDVIIIFQTLILVMALAIDAFVCSFAYGANQIKIPFKSTLLINAICTGLLGAGLFLGTALGSIFPEELVEWMAFIILFLLGVSKIFESAIKRLIQKKRGINKKLTFSFLNLGFILKIYANPEEADFDRSKELSLKESIPLAIAIGLDGLSVGLGLGMVAINAFLILGTSFIVGVLAVIIGCFLGRVVARKASLDLNWLTGVILISIAFVELLF